MAGVLPGAPCERFAREAGAPACKVNKLRWCQTDLGSYALRWPRLMREARRFGNMATECDPDGLRIGEQRFRLMPCKGYHQSLGLVHAF